MVTNERYAELAKGFSEGRKLIVWATPRWTSWGREFMPAQQEWLDIDFAPTQQDFPPKPTADEVALLRHEGHRVELTGECRRVRKGELFDCLDDGGVRSCRVRPACYDNDSILLYYSGNRWILRIAGKKLRAYTAEELCERVPAGTVLLHKDNPKASVLVLANVDTGSVLIGGVGSGPCGAETLLRDYIHVDKKPCGVEE